MKLVLLCLLVASVTARENLNTLLLQLKRALGEELQPANTESCGFRGDVIFLLDASSSINEDDYAISKTFVKDLIGGFNVAPDQVRVGVVAFNQFVHVAYHLDKITEEGQTAETIQNLVDTVAPIKTGTFTDKGLRTIREEMFLPEKGDRPDAPNIVITITDGRSRNQTKTIKEAQLLREAGVVMIAVGIGKWRSDEELQVLSSNDKFMISVDNFDGLDTIKTVLAKRTCKALEDPPQFITECSARADVLFVIDGSSSVKDEDFTIAKRFITTILDSFIVSSKYLQVAAMSFDQKVRHGFYFNTYKTIGDMKEGIMEMQQYQRSMCFFNATLFKTTVRLRLKVAGSIPGFGIAYSMTGMAVSASKAHGLLSLEFHQEATTSRNPLIYQVLNRGPEHRLVREGFICYAYLQISGLN